jgi:predicted PhzF superfamily epimerase YddE/YHI9
VETLLSPSKEVDFVSHFFAPQSGIAEDPRNGSAIHINPYWSRQLGKNSLTALPLWLGADLINVPIRENE